MARAKTQRAPPDRLATWVMGGLARPMGASISREVHQPHLQLLGLLLLLLLLRQRQQLNPPRFPRSRLGQIRPSRPRLHQRRRRPSTVPLSLLLLPVLVSTSTVPPLILPSRHILRLPSPRTPPSSSSSDPRPRTSRHFPRLSHVLDMILTEQCRENYG